ncbi:hypothetical protein GCM10010406_45530 [Streptomyces thermolineatus]|uniref:Uncharacterized protein n=1 Tax=Streptomyces thermolineatus TaxID=44033 RepID=A0ABN3MKT9_9ACTN
MFRIVVSVRRRDLRESAFGRCGVQEEQEVREVRGVQEVREVPVGRGGAERIGGPGRGDGRRRPLARSWRSTVGPGGPLRNPPTGCFPRAAPAPARPRPGPGPAPVLVPGPRGGSPNVKDR